jgi:hypothetical protein
MWRGLPVYEDYLLLSIRFHYSLLGYRSQQWIHLYSIFSRRYPGDESPAWEGGGRKEGRKQARKDALRASWPIHYIHMQSSFLFHLTRLSHSNAWQGTASNKNNNNCFFETKSFLRTQRRYRTQYVKAPTSDNAIRRLLKQFQATGSVLYRKGAGRPSTSQDDVHRIQEAFSRSPQKSTRWASLQLGIQRTTLWRVVRNRLHFHDSTGNKTKIFLVIIL